MSARRQWARPDAELPPWKRALTLLQDNGGAPMTAGSVAVLLGQSAGYARGLLDKLVRQGQAERINDNGTVVYQAAPTTETPGGVDHGRS